MPRPTEACARCLKLNLTGCDHLGAIYDEEWAKFSYGNPQATIEQFEQEQLVYGLNRKWALRRDNGNKKEGQPASRIYNSRNLTSARALAALCGWQKPGSRLKCIKPPHPDEPERHKF